MLCPLSLTKHECLYMYILHILHAHMHCTLLIGLCKLSCQFTFLISNHDHFSSCSSFVFYSAAFYFILVLLLFHDFFSSLLSLSISLHLSSYLSLLPLPSLLSLSLYFLHPPSLIKHCTICLTFYCPSHCSYLACMIPSSVCNVHMHMCNPTSSSYVFNNMRLFNVTHKGKSPVHVCASVLQR